MMGDAALAATEVSRAVRERGVQAFDDTESFVARDTTSSEVCAGLVHARAPYM